MLKRIALALCVALCGFFVASSLQGCATTKTASASTLCTQIGEIVLIEECFRDVTDLCLRENPGVPKHLCVEAAQKSCTVIRCSDFDESPAAPESL